MANKNVETYVFFGGNCEAALDFYKTAIGAQIGTIIHYNESPEPVPADQLPEGFETKVMHSLFTVGDTTIMASDGNHEQASFSGFQLVLNVATEADADRYFENLSYGGKVVMPLQKTFWSPRYGMLTDRFGVGWMVMVAVENPKP